MTYGTLAILTSRRTPRTVLAALESLQRKDIKVIGWTPGERVNPYPALISLSDNVVVSGDSISMMVEAVRLGKPLAIASLPTRNVPWVRLYWGIARRFRAATTDGAGLPSRLKRLLHGTGIYPFVRDLEAFHSLLINKGIARKLGHEPLPAPTLPQDNLSQVVDRIHALFPSEKGSSDNSRR